jgi:tetratricopeptide (TPR) repeat protein
MKHGIVTSAAAVLALGMACGGTSTADTDPSLLATHAPPTKTEGGRRAPPPAPLPVDPLLEEARDEFTVGLQAFDAGDYSTAIEKFRTAYEASPRPAILFNIAVCQERLGQLAGALASYRIYLREMAPDMSPEMRAETERKIRALETELGITP